MKKVLALALFISMISLSVTAQNGFAERVRKHRIEQRLHNRNSFQNSYERMKLRNEVIRHKMMKHRAVRNRSITQGERRKMRMLQMQQRRKMMIRRHYMHRRVI
jgi:hypothetical protein